MATNDGVADREDVSGRNSEFEHVDELGKICNTYVTMFRTDEHFVLDERFMLDEG